MNERSFIHAGLAALWLRGCHRVGRRAVLRGRPRIENLGALLIGDDVELSSSPVQSHLATGPRGELTLADGVRIGYGAAISAQARVTIGEGAVLGPYALILDSDFHQAHDHAAPGASAPIEIGSGAVLGPRVTLLRGARIGVGATIAAGSVVSGEIPAGARASGVPARAQSGRAAEASVPLIVKRVFKLRAAPLPDDGPHSIPSWDSLGTLRLWVALEEELSVKLSEQDFAQVKSVRDLEALAGVTAVRYTDS